MALIILLSTRKLFIQKFPKFSISSKSIEVKQNKMHTFLYRANALLTFSITILALICGMASFSDYFNHPSPSAHVQVLNVRGFQKLSNGNDEIAMNLNITADLQSLFTWNTKQIFQASYSASNSQYCTSCSRWVRARWSKVFVFLAAEYETPKNALNQVSLWDGIIPSKEHAKFSIQTINKYRFIDQGSNLRGKEYNMTLHWHVMPKTGKMLVDKIVLSGFSFPDEYR